MRLIYVLLRSLIIYLFFLHAAVNAQFLLKRNSINTPDYECIYDTNTEFDKSNPDSTFHFYNQNYVPEWYDMFANIPNNWYRYGKEVFQTENIVPIYAMAAITGLMIITDRETWEVTAKPYKKPGPYHTFSDIFEFMGDGIFQFGLAGSFAAYGFIDDDKRALRTASQIVQAMLATGTVIQVLKHITGRESPAVASTPTGKWQWFPNQIEYHKKIPYYDAFPSGHIATATTTLIVISENYPEQKWIRPLGYAILAGISTALVATDLHWWSDIPLGIAIGYSFGMIAAHPEGIKIENEEDSKSSVFIFPHISPYGNGISISYGF